MKFVVLDCSSEVVGEIELSDLVFGLEPRADILHRMVLWQLAKRRSGTHKVKTVGEITATTKKMSKQKGTGCARHGSKKVSQFRGGAKVMGPVVRSHAFDLTKKFRKLALCTALSSKVKTKQIVILKNFELNKSEKVGDKFFYKTSVVDKVIKNFGWSSVLFVGNSVDSNFDAFRLAARNIPYASCIADVGVNPYDILKKDVLVMTEDAIRLIEGRLK